MNSRSSNQWQRGDTNAEMSSPPASREADGENEAGSSALVPTARNQTEDELSWEAIFAETQVDSDLDGILVVDRHGEKILQNQRHRELWKIPARISEDYSEQLKFVTVQVFRGCSLAGPSYSRRGSPKNS
jgi:hypothetical protein